MNKCCLNCAFCMRCIDKTSYDMLALKSTNDDITTILTNEERKQAFAGNFEFIGKEIRIQKEWEVQYEQLLDNMKKGMYNKRLGGDRVLELLAQDSMAINKYSLSSVFGMSPHPDAPNDDYLECWHEQWEHFDENEDLKTLSIKSCPFFYSYEKKGKKSFECCEKERLAELEYSRYKTTNWLVIAGIIVSIIAIIASIIIYQLQKTDTIHTLSFVQKGLENIQKQETEIKNTISEQLGNQNNLIDNKINQLKKEQDILSVEIQKEIESISNKIDMSKNETE
ncbi:MAG: hypothetical protein J6V53_04995 [Alphaproteobacteria bacterium]|nr:hypothetical protein [Alphaproteobacteria bacterium]